MAPVDLGQVGSHLEDVFSLDGDVGGSALGAAGGFCTGRGGRREGKEGRRRGVEK
jgi:hypothetical protein